MTSPGLILLVLGPVAPLLVALASVFASRPGRLLPYAAVPALLAAFVAPHGELASLPAVVLGVGFMLDPISAVFLGFVAFLWTCAGVFAVASIGGKPRERSFAVFWNLTLAGTLGAMCAADAVTFYVSFAALSLAAYMLVIHDRTAAAERAGRIYIILAVFGEISLLLGLLLAATTTDSLLIAEIRDGLALSPFRDLAVLALVVGFGLKAGLIPLHVWLPLAHSAAPVPASAVLSGAIVKAGIIGLIRFLPMEGALPEWAVALTWLGLATAYYGVIMGLPQRHPKAVLAYSTLSQMGLLVSVLGAGMASPAIGATHAAAALYATHHGLAKAALFLSVGVMAASGARAARPVLMIAVLLGAAVAGLPFSGGALAKLAIKGPLGEGPAALLATVSAIGTMLLMLRFAVLLRDARSDNASASPSLALAIPFAAIALAALLVPWVLFPSLTGEAIGYALAPAALWTATWPLLVALVLGIGASRLDRRGPIVPIGDVVVFAEWFAYSLKPLFDWRASVSVSPSRPSWMIAPGFDGVERRLRAWAVSGTLLLAIAMALWLMSGR